MATKSNITIRLEDPFSIVQVKVASAVVIARGDLIDFDGTDAAIHAGEAGTFLGVAGEGSENGDTHDIPVATRALVSILNQGAALVLGDAVDYRAGSNGVNWDVEKNVANAIAWAAENNIASGAKGLFRIDIQHLGDTAKLFDVTT